MQQAKKYDKLVMGLLLLGMNIMTACGGSGDPNLYIEYEESPYTLRVVKYLTPGDAAANGVNIVNEVLGTTTIGGRNFYMYSVPKKELDIYTETNYPANYGGFVNDRQKVNLKLNDWAKLELWKDKHGDYRVTDGKGDIQ